MTEHEHNFQRAIGGGIRCICGEAAPDALTDDVPAGREQTSRDAFHSVQHSGARTGDQQRVLRYIGDQGGATCDEAEVALQLRHQTASARFNDLKRAGLIVKSGRRRPTRSGRKADVYVVERVRW